MNTDLPWEIIIEPSHACDGSTGALYFDPNNNSLWFLDSGEWITISNNINDSITWVNNSMKVEENNAHCTINTSDDNWAEQLMEIMEHLDEEIEKVFNVSNGKGDAENQKVESPNDAYERAMRGI